ncbi:MAG: competence/damage-inducible protein A [Pseudonocardiaceae bacterium]
MSSGDGDARAGIVVTGSELLTGRIADRNGPWVAQRLGERGVEVTHVLCVGDRAGDLDQALRFLAAQRVDVIVTSGGLGPTADDMTTEVVARFAGRELALDEGMRARIAAIVDRFAAGTGFGGEPAAVAIRKQAMVPRGAATIDPTGTAPGLVVPVEGGPVVIALPGPPRELQGMWEQALDTPPARAVLDRVRPYSAVALRLFGLPEPEIAQTLREVGARVDLSALEITTCLRGSELEVDVRYRAGGRAASEQLVEEIVRRHGHHLVSRDGSSTGDQVAALLRGRRIGVAESCTGGLLAARLTDRAGSSEYVAGGVVAYSDEAKVELLGVPASLIAQHGAVSPEVAMSMADGARRRFAADLGVGITGVAGPGGGTEAKPVGYVCLCVTTADGAVLARDPVLPGDRADIRDRSVDVALHLVNRILQPST